MFVAPHHQGRTQKRGYSIPQISSRFVTAEQTDCRFICEYAFWRRGISARIFLAVSKMAFQVNAGLDDGDAFAFEEFSLQRSVRLANEDFAAFAEDAMPGDAFSGRGRGHGATRAARATGKT